MQNGDVGLVLREALLLVVMLGGPPLATALVVGLFISIIQAVTQINEATLVFVPKVLAIGVVLLVTGAFMLGRLMDFTHMILDRVVAAGG